MEPTSLSNKVKARFDHDTAKRMLQERYEAKMLFAYNGGMWRAGPSLLTTISVCPNEDCVLVDEYNNPVQINTVELKLLAQQRWQEQMNAWHAEHEELSSQR